MKDLKINTEEMSLIVEMLKAASFPSAKAKVVAGTLQAKLEKALTSDRQTQTVPGTSVPGNSEQVS